VIGTPFTISVADEILENSVTTLETLEPTDNTIWTEPITETFPLTEVSIDTTATTITYTEEDVTTSTWEDETITTGWIETLIFTGSETLSWIQSTVISGNITITGDMITTNTDSETIVEPTLITTEAQKTIITDTNGRIDPSNIDSYNVIDRHSDITFCSYITYLNLKHITQFNDDMFIRGNAIDVRNNLTTQATLSGSSEHIFTGTNMSGTQFIEHLSGVYASSGSTLFDIVTFKPKKPEDQTLWFSLHQSHRFVVFLGTDDKRYVLDPVRTSSSEPIFLSDYLTQFIFNQEDLKIVQHYTLDNYTEEKTENKDILTGIVVQTGGIVVHSPMEFLPYVLQWLITSTKTGELISNEVIFHTGFRYETISGDLSAYIPAGLVIRTADGNDFNISALQIKQLSGEKDMIDTSEYSSQFKFGISGQHLIFSQPIQLTIQTPDHEEGDILNLMVQHEGQDWNQQWLTANKDAICQIDGSVPKSDQLFTTIVKSNHITFYSCGASTFTANPVGGITNSNDLKLTITDQWVLQVYYNGLTQIYWTSVYPNLRVGTALIWNGATAWNSAITSGSQFGNTYTAQTLLSAVVWGLTYQVIMDRSYTAPDKAFTQRYTWIIPAGNTQNVKWYYGMDSFVAWADANDVWYGSGLTTSNPTVGIFDNIANILLWQTVRSWQSFSGWYAGPYWAATPSANAGNYPNTINTTPWDDGFWVNWDFGTTPGTRTSTIQWTMKPYVTANVSDLIPGIWQPQGNLVIWSISQMPITLTNVGNLSSSGNHQIVLIIPTNISWPTTGFSNNGWNCGAQIGTTVTCLKTTTIWPNSGDYLNIPVIPSLAASGTNPTFSITIANSGDSNITNNTASVIIQTPVIINSFSNNARLRLKADSLTSLSDWSNVSVWNNLWSRSHATQSISDAQPKLRKKINNNLIDNINFNPIVEFNGTGNYMLVTGWLLAASTWWDAYVYVVSSSKNVTQFLFNENDASPYMCPRLSAHIPWADNNIYWDAGDCGGGSRLATNRWWTNNNSYLWSLSKSTTNTAQNVKQDIRRNWLTIATSSTTNSIVWNNSNLFLWSDPTPGNFFPWKIAEILVYLWNWGIINFSQQNKIESYLSLKYGITLNQSIVWWQNYTLNNGSIAWSTGSAGTYNKDIAGIARDDSIGLSQLKSQSINNTGDIIVSSNSLINNQTLVRANDLWSTTWWTTAEIPTIGIASRISREWKFQEKNGDVGNVSITYPISAWSLPNGTLVLLQDTDGNFSNWGTSIYTGSLSGWIWIYNNINIQDNNYITFWILNNATICIEWPDSISSWSLTATNSNQTLELQSNYFKIDDQKGSNSGYYTTLSFSNLTWSLTGFIPLSAMQIKVDPITTLSWSTNPAVTMNSSLGSYSSISNPIQFIKRSVWSWANILWTYGSRIRLKINIPAYQPIWTYTWTITYTLYEN
jgi:hypothetical protein